MEQKPKNQQPTAGTASIEYPVRINRYLKLKHIASRRESDRLIEAGEVFINGKKAVLGAQVQAGDKVTVGKGAQNKLDNRVYLILNKPVGYVSHNPQRGEKSATGLFPKSMRSHNLAPLGRLDKASEGLMIYTDDGRIIHGILSPEFEHEKEYEVTVNRAIKDSELRRLQKPMKLEDFTTKPSETKRIGDNRFRIILTEGKKHQIRRMCDKLNVVAVKLERLRNGEITTKNLDTGQWRHLTKNEVDFLLKTGLK